MKVGAVVPCYREPIERVAHTVASIRACSSITEIVLVDDGCNDTDLDALSGVRVVHLPENVGPAAAMNRGVDALDAGIICRLDVGDVFRPIEKERQIDTVRSGVRASFSLHFDLVEHKVFFPPAAWANRIYVDGAFCICTAVVTRSVWDSVNGFDESLRYGDDWDFTMRVQHAIGWTMFHEVTCEAGAFNDGHTKRAGRDPITQARKISDSVRCLQTGKRLSHPGSMAHLDRPRKRP